MADAPERVRIVSDVDPATAAMVVDKLRLAGIPARVLKGEPPAEPARVTVSAAPSALANLSLMEFIPRVSPEFQSPTHLRELCSEFEKIALGEPVRTLVACPIRHWKTQVMLHGLVWLLCKDPSARFLLLSHSFERATALGKRVRQIAYAAGVGPAKGLNTIADWSTEQGGGVLIMSADQSRLGYDVHGLFFDDPLDEMGAHDPKKREEVDETIVHYTARCQRRGKPGPVMGIMSRWDPDDPIGRRLGRSVVAWRYIHYPAILDDGLPTERAFAPEVWSLEALRAMRAELAEQDPTERLWWAQLMGDPKPVGSDLFREPTWYTTLPEWSFRVGYGADLAFTSGASSDWCAFVAGKVYGRHGYLLDAQRHKLDPHMIESTARAMLNRYGYGPIYTYMSGPEIGVAKLMRERGLPFVDMPARYNKLVRAQRTITRWNDGQISVPEGAPWAKGFLHRVACFRGNDHDEGDDEVDALVSWADGVFGGAVAGQVKSFGRAYQGIGASGSAAGLGRTV